MKLIRIVFLFILTGLSGCGDNIGPNANYVSFEIDGVFWESNDITASGTAAGSGIISVNILARNLLGETLEIRVFSGNQNAIEYVFDQSIGITYTPSGSGSTAYQSNNCTNVSGGIIFSERAVNFVSGTFRGAVCLPSGEVKQIRNGFFNQVIL
jgi:hypothetical protein